MSWIEDVANEIAGVVATAWPETDDNRMRGKSGANINWREWLSKAEAGGDGLSLPIAVVEITRADPAPDYGDGNDVYTIPVKLYYLQSWNSGDTRLLGRQMDDLLLAKAEAIRSAFSGTFTNFQLVGQVTWDGSMYSPTNQYLLKRQFQIAALEVTIPILAGVSSEA